MSMPVRTLWLASAFVCGPLFARTDLAPSSGVSFERGWRPAHVVQRFERDALTDFLQFECGKEVAGLLATYSHYALVSYHPQSNPKRKAYRVVAVADEASDLASGHVMIYPADCRQALLPPPTEPNVSLN
jgi:hypothetical protein